MMASAVRRRLVVRILTVVLLGVALVGRAQTGTAPATATALRPWEVAAGGPMKFASTSIRRDNSGIFKKPSFALSADDGLPPADGNFRADFPLIVYIQFAYKQWFTEAQMHALLAPLPKWVMSDSYEIQARAAGKPTKDQMRLMLQSLLTDRFGLQVHYETRRVPVFVLTLIKPGKMGPRLHAHTPSCDSGATGKSAAAKDVFPPPCLDQALMTIPKANHVKLTGSRNMSMAVLATYLPSIGDLDRPVIDRTGIAGGVDFSLEFTPEAYLPESTDGNSDSDTPIRSFQEALGNELGLMLSPAKEPLDVLVVDHVEKPAEDSK